MAPWNSFQSVIVKPELLIFASGLAEEETYQSSSSPLQIIENFLEALTNADKDGRVVVNKQGVDSEQVKFARSVSSVASAQN